MNTAAYGSWPSPLAISDLSLGEVRLDELRVDGPDTYWVEGRPADQGRAVLVRHDGATGEISDVTPAPWNVRSRVHGYGGGTYAVRGGTIVFTHLGDGRVYRLAPGDAEPQPVTPPGDYLIGGLVLHDGIAYAVREDHTGVGEAVDQLIAIDLSAEPHSSVRVLWQDSDFVSRPAISADGKQIAFVTWEHPNLPWDSTTLRRALLTADGLGELRIVDGGEEVSVSQPHFSPDGTLYYLADSTGWWNLYRDSEVGPVPVRAVAADCARPQWVLGMHDLAVLDDGRMVGFRWAAGRARLELLDREGRVSELDPEVIVADMLQAHGDEIALLAGSSTRPTRVVRGRVGEPLVTLRAARTDGLPAAYVSVAEPWTWTDSEGLEVHGMLYRPRHAEFTGPQGELPPLVVMVHGGPTSMHEPAYNSAIQFWTTRGFAVLHVNYSGSTGYGREYRNRLRGRWGEIDIDDCVTGARSLADAGIVDGAKMAIRGGSAGGYVVLQAMTTSKAFAAGASYYGVTDLALLAAETHKFESRYTDLLVGPYPEAAQLYAARSPVNHAAELSGALLMLQGDDDEVVPLSQAEVMAEALRAAGKQVELVVYPGEGHGFRGATAVQDSIHRELAFYADAMGFTLPTH